MERDYIVFQTGFDGWAIILRLVCFFPGFIYLTPSVNNNLISKFCLLSAAAGSYYVFPHNFVLYYMKD